MLITLDQLKTSLSAVKNYITSVLPTKTSDLTNDSGFITNATVPTATTSKSGTTTTLTVTDKNGTTTVQILDGAKGDTGDSGVYVGDTEPTGDEKVWVDLSGYPDVDSYGIVDLKNSIDAVKQFSFNETTANVKTELIPDIPSTFSTVWNIGQPYYYVSNRVIPKGSFIKNIKIGTRVSNDGTIILVDDNDTVVYKYFVSCTANQWNIFDINLLANENLRVAVNARQSWSIDNVSDDAAFGTDGLWSSTQTDVEVGTIMTFSQANTNNFMLAVQWEIETGDKIADSVVVMKAKRPSSGYENFSVNVNYSEYTTNENDALTEYTDYGVVALPESYSINGNPTPLIIFCQGSGERTGIDTNPLSNYGWEYFLAKGYAVMDMNGISAAWSTAQGFPNTGLHYCNKYLLSSYTAGYKYVTEKYNVSKRVYVAGISVGGGAAALITQSNVIPVIANALFCPALSVYKQDYMSPWGGTNQQKTIAGQWGFPDWSTTTPSQEYFLSNIDKIKGFDNLLIRTIGDHETANANFGNDAEATAYNSMQKIYPVPLKIWHCENDNLVLFRYSQFMVNMIKNGGGQAWLRSFATGGHPGGWNTGSVTDAGVTTSIPFYEAVLFFERFKN